MATQTSIKKLRDWKKSQKKYALIAVEVQENGTFVATSEIFPQIVVEGSSYVDVVDDFRECLIAMIAHCTSESKTPPFIQGDPP